MKRLGPTPVNLFALQPLSGTCRALIQFQRLAGFVVTPPVPAVEPGQIWVNEVETIRVDRVDQAGIWITWLRHPLIARQMETCGAPSAFERWVRDTGASIMESS